MFEHPNSFHALAEEVVAQDVSDNDVEEEYVRRSIGKRSKKNHIKFQRVGVIFRIQTFLTFWEFVEKSKVRRRNFKMKDSRNVSMGCGMRLRRSRM